MGRIVPEEVKQQVADAINKDGLSAVEAGKKFGVTDISARRWASGVNIVGGRSASKPRGKSAIPREPDTAPEPRAKRTSARPPAPRAVSVAPAPETLSDKEAFDVIYQTLEPLTKEHRSKILKLTHLAFDILEGDGAEVQRLTAQLRPGEQRANGVHA